MKANTPKFFLLLLLLLLYVIFHDAIPLSRSMKAFNGKKPMNYDNTRSQDIFDFGREDREALGTEETYEGRMLIQTNDYPGTGANNNHNPKPPGRV